jgi:hypothetical protein
MISERKFLSFIFWPLLTLYTENPFSLWSSFCKLLHDVKERTGYSPLKEEALDALWKGLRTCRQTDCWMMNESLSRRSKGLVSGRLRSLAAEIVGKHRAVGPATPSRHPPGYYLRKSLAQLIKKLPSLCVELESTSPCSQQPATSTYL